MVIIMASIRTLILDVDGTLTDSNILYGDNHIEIKAFNTKDGLILKVFPRLGIPVIFLTGRNSEAVSRRAADLGAMAVQGVDNKPEELQGLFVRYDIKSEECAYIGDDLNDFPAMRICGFKACPADAAEEIRDICDYISPYKGGYGAVRDICEYMLRQNGRYDDFLRMFHF